MRDAPLWHPYGDHARKLASFLAVGGLSAAAYAVTCTLLVQWLPAYKAAISIGVHCFLIPIAFLAQRHITFRSANHWLREFLQYAALQVASISISTWTLVRFVTGNPYIDMLAFLAIAAFAAIISYLICNSIIFRNTAFGRRTDERM